MKRTNERTIDSKSVELENDASTDNGQSDDDGGGKKSGLKSTEKAKLLKNEKGSIAFSRRQWPYWIRSEEETTNTTPDDLAGTRRTDQWDRDRVRRSSDADRPLSQRAMIKRRREFWSEPMRFVGSSSRFTGLPDFGTAASYRPLRSKSKNVFSARYKSEIKTENEVFADGRRV